MMDSPGSRGSVSPVSGQLPVEPSLGLGALARMLRGRGLGVELRLPGGEVTKVTEAAEAAEALETRADGVILTGVEQDSRRVASGDLFLAWKGTHHDAHGFLGDAMARGAAAALVEHFVDDAALPQLRVTDGRAGAAIAAMMVLGDPAGALRVTAVTGTNGKTTTALLARHLLGSAVPTAAMGTLGVVSPDGRVRDGTGGLTTPGPAALARTLRGLVDEGVRALVMEASSHALEQRRLDGLRVNIAAFTNLTRDHLDYHLSMGAYLEAKAHLLNLLSEDAEVVVNTGDPAWSGLPPVRARLRPVGFAGEPAPGMPSAAERLPALQAHRVRYSGTGARFDLEEEGRAEAHEVRLPLLGRFNVENALVAAGIALAAGLTLGAVAEALSGAPAPTGRMELTLTEPVPVILDYAHTPDALARAIETLRPLYPGRLIVVFGAGGDRDRTKRPEMGRIAAEGSGLAIVTSDNPRTEDPAAIVDDIVAGMPPEGEGHRWIRIEDRRQAIARALELAVDGDAILLAGKGHETYQVVGTEVRDFDERAVLRELLSGEAGA